MTAEEICDNLKKVREDIARGALRYGRNADEISLMGVTKTVPCQYVNAAIDGGLWLLGENRVQEYLEKKGRYLKGAQIHFIGRLQTNKVKYIINDICMIHSVDSMKLAYEIDKRAAERRKSPMDILIEVNTGGESSKGGVSEEALDELVKGVSVLPYLRLRGFMAIPPADDPEMHFEKMRVIFMKYKSEMTGIDILSMGMSGDYELAIKHGSTLIRLGSAIFGSRNK